jgi:hypothetical protein
MTKPYEVFAAIKRARSTDEASEAEYWVQIGANGPVWGPYATEEQAEAFGQNYTGTAQPTNNEHVCPTCKRPHAQYVDPSADRNFYD